MGQNKRASERFTKWNAENQTVLLAVETFLEHQEELSKELHSIKQENFQGATRRLPNVFDKKLQLTNPLLEKTNKAKVPNFWGKLRKV